MGRYDEDYSDPRQYCVHGTFIGSWWGPDYLCGYCEAGVSRRQQARWMALDAGRKARMADRRLREFIDASVRFWGDLTPDGQAAYGQVLADLARTRDSAREVRREAIALVWSERRGKDALA